MPFLVSLPRREAGVGLGDLLSFGGAWPGGTSSFGPKRDDSRRDSVFACGAVFSITGCSCAGEVSFFVLKTTALYKIERQKGAFYLRIF